jgi:hypothetical protein
MKKQPESTGDTAVQLGFELVCLPVERAFASNASEHADLQPIVTNSVVDLAPSLHRRAAESDRALLKAVQSRAAHLTDCLFRRP